MVKPSSQKSTQELVKLQIKREEIERTSSGENRVKIWKTVIQREKSQKSEMRREVFSLISLLVALSEMV